MIILIDGDNNSGKTALLAWLSQYIHRPLWSNFRLLQHDFYKELTIDDIINLNALLPTYQASGLVMYIDEAYTWLEARLSSQATNIFLSHNTNYQWRKRGLDVYLTFQDFMSIDIRYRMRFDIFIEAQYRDLNSNDDFIYNYYRHNKKVRGKKKLYTLRIPYDTMKKIFPLFDTYEIVEPLNRDRMIYNIAKKNPKLMKKTLNRYYDTLLPQVEKEYDGNMTHEDLELMLISNLILPEYQKKLYNMLKKKKRL